MPIHERSFQAMNTTFSLRIDLSNSTLCFHQSEHPEAFLKKLEREITHTEATLSRFRADSELTLLNQTIGSPRHISPLMRDVLTQSIIAHKRSGGTFDPRILSSLHRTGYPGSPLPAHVLHTLIDKTQPLVTWLAVDEIILHAPIDLGGIAKGFTADRMLSRVMDTYRESLQGAIINAGGDIATVGTQATGEPYQLGVQHPLRPNELAAAVQMPETPCGLCTSATWKRQFTQDGRTMHHLIDPGTGDSIDTDILAVTVLGESAVSAEIDTKRIFLDDTTLDRKRAASLIFRAPPGKDGIYATRSAPIKKHLTWYAPDVTWIDDSAE
ncbi:FAD:protein FMN transferase [Ferroacidibacillus organovorans]|uniref:FAD:protein FMN transferase n=1 Tax=Ferroacidibacillus organovorans TaxID=1765683 RepID=A0A101XR37_9BACL|nr:FAD:protein FMN transferase [Ferroacidibacillus organovorans]KUO95996.1 hypothetical protein ATW55_02660 [Ferroacidibacillus organovorans]